MITKKQIGLFGGSFDPPHLGHVALVEAGLAMGMDEVWVIPALPVHRELSGHADGAMRLRWLQQVFEGDDRVKVLDWEVRQSLPTPMVDTLRRFRARYPDLVPWLMLGTDVWHSLDRWREYPAHQRLCNVAVFARQQAALSSNVEVKTRHPGWQEVALAGWKDCTTAAHWCDITVALPDISATMIRERAYSGLSLTDLVPKVLQSEIEKRYIENMRAIEKHKG